MNVPKHVLFEPALSAAAAAAVWERFTIGRFSGALNFWAWMGVYVLVHRSLDLIGTQLEF